jgi:hypothetical protein
MNKIITTLFTLILLSSLTSASYYIEATNNVHNNEDSFYIHPDFLPKADVFYTPFNAYRTYCDASYCPTETKIIQIQKVPVQLKEPKLIIIHKPYPYHPPIITSKIIRPTPTVWIN